MEVFDPAGRLRGTLDLRRQRGTAVSFSPDGRTLAVAATPPTDTDQTVHGLFIWDVKTLRTIKEADLKEDYSPTSLAFTPDGARVVLNSVRRGGTGGGLIQIWRTRDLLEKRATPEREFAPGQGYVFDFALHPDNRTLAVGGGDRRIHLWDLTTGREVSGSFGTHPAVIVSVAFSPDGRTLASTTTQDEVVRLWDVASKTLLASLSGHTGPINGSRLTGRRDAGERRCRRGRRCVGLVAAAGDGTHLPERERPGAGRGLA